MTNARRGGAIILLVLVLWITSQSAAGKTFQVCEDEFSEASGLVDICRPLGPTDPPFLVAVLLALSPLAPDLQRLQIGSLLSIERRLKATETSQEALKAQVEAIVVQQSVRQEQHQHLHVAPPHATSHMAIHVTEEELQRRKREFLEGTEEQLRRDEDVTDGQ